MSHLLASRRRWSTRGVAPPNSNTFNTGLTSKSRNDLVALMTQPVCGGILGFNGRYQSIHSFGSMASHDDHGETDSIVGSSSDDQAMHFVNKLSDAAFGFCAIIVPKADIDPEALQGQEAIPVEKLAGTVWQDKTDHYFQSRLITWLYPSGVDPQYGMLTDPDYVSAFRQITPDAPPWINHIELAFLHQKDINRVFTAIKGEEQRYVHSTYDDRRWPASGPVLEPSFLSPDDQKSIYTRLSAAANAGQAAPPMAQALPPAPLAPQTTTAASSVRSTQAASAKTPSSSTLSQTHIMLRALKIRAQIDWKTGKKVGPLLPPAFNEAATEALGKKSIGERSALLLSAWNNTLNPEYEDSLDLASASDPDKTGVT